MNLVPHVDIIGDDTIQQFMEDPDTVVLRTPDAEILENWILDVGQCYQPFPKIQIDCLLMEETFRCDFIAMLMRKQRYLAERILYLTAHEVEDRFFSFSESNLVRKRRIASQ